MFPRDLSKEERGGQGSITIVQHGGPVQCRTKRRPAELSGGICAQRRQCVRVRGAMDPEMLLLDEAAVGAGLPCTVLIWRDEIEAIWRQGQRKTCVLTHQMMSTKRSFWADRDHRAESRRHIGGLNSIDIARPRDRVGRCNNNAALLKCRCGDGLRPYLSWISALLPKSKRRATPMSRRSIPCLQRCQGAEWRIQ